MVNLGTTSFHARILLSQKKKKATTTNSTVSADWGGREKATAARRGKGGTLIGKGRGRGRKIVGRGNPIGPNGQTFTGEPPPRRSKE